jgi:hypothetical protein
MSTALPDAGEIAPVQVVEALDDAGLDRVPPEVALAGLGELLR